MGYWFTTIGLFLAIISAILLFVGFLISPNDNFIKGPNSIKQIFSNNASVNIKHSPGTTINIDQSQQNNYLTKLPSDIKKEEPVQIKLTYKPPKLTEDDKCDENCVGIYTKIAEDDDFLYLDHPSFKTSRLTGYNYDSDKNGEKIITNWNVEEKRNYDSIALPKHLILNIVRLSNSTSTQKQISNYKILK